MTDVGVCLFKNGFKNPNWPNDLSFYQILYDGKTKLLKHISHTLRDCYEYGGIYRQCFKKQEKVYLQVNNGSLVQIDKEPEKIWELLTDVSDTKDFATKQKLKLKRWNDVAKILEYYDSKP